MKSETVLIIDADSVIRDMMEKIIAPRCKTCTVASDGVEALELLKEMDFDIVIADVNLPGIDGLSLMAHVRKIKPETVFMIITGYSKDYSYDKIIKAGAKDFLKKPFTIEELKNKLERILDEREMEKEIKALLQKQADLNDQMATLLAVASDLTAELDFDTLFTLIVGKITEAMGAERTSFYITDWTKREIWTKVSQGIDTIHLPLGHGISGRVAESGVLLNVSDAWELPYFNREFDLKHNFRTGSVLATPVKNHLGEGIGVLQVINKKNGERFNSGDEVFLKSLASQVGIALENSLLHEEVNLSFESSIRTLAATVDARHPLTAGHSNRVTTYSLMIGKKMGLEKRAMDALNYAALLHDIGKIGISDAVLLKNGRFTDEERAEMNTHTEKTEEILNKFHFPKNMEGVPEIAAGHHEKVDGNGYHKGLVSDEIPFGSKIIAVADVFDALTSPRDYPKYAFGKILDCDLMPLAKVISILKNDSGSHFDKKVVTAFLECLPRALLDNRGSHFTPEYVDDTIRSLDPGLLP
jgi:response regulator RpfG family c-di-GMP phosphodiesterase